MKKAEHKERQVFLELNGCALISQDESWTKFWAWYFPPPFKPGGYTTRFAPKIIHNGEELFCFGYSNNKWSLTKDAYDHYIDFFLTVS